MLTFDKAAQLIRELEQLSERMGHLNAALLEMQERNLTPPASVLAEQKDLQRRWHQASQALNVLERPEGVPNARHGL